MVRDLIFRRLWVAPQGGQFCVKTLLRFHFDGCGKLQLKKTAEGQKHGDLVGWFHSFVVTFHVNCHSEIVLM